MDFDTLALREIALDLNEPFKVSFGEATKKHILILEAREGDDWFYGEAAPIRHPLYNSEAIFTTKEALKRYVTMALDYCQSVEGYRELISNMEGHNFAKAAGETLLYHRQSVTTGTPLHECIGGTKDEADCGGSIGIKEEQEAVDKIEAFLDRGYSRIKVKIEPGQDVDYVDTIRDYFPDIDLIVDANAAYTLEDADRLAELDQYDLEMIEQPLPNRDIVNHSVLASRLDTPLCLDESIHSAEDVERAARVDACDIINLKPQRVSGLLEAQRINEACKEHGMEMWVGGVGESAIGMSYTVAAASLDGVTLPGETVPTGRFYEDKIVESGIEMVDGRIDMPDSPGLLATVDRDRLEEHTVYYEDLTDHEGALDI